MKRFHRLLSATLALAMILSTLIIIPTVATAATPKVNSWTLDGSKFGGDTGPFTLAYADKVQTVYGCGITGSAEFDSENQVYVNGNGETVFSLIDNTLVFHSIGDGAGTTNKAPAVTFTAPTSGSYTISYNASVVENTAGFEMRFMKSSYNFDSSSVVNPSTPTASATVDLNEGQTIYFYMRTGAPNDAEQRVKFDITATYNCKTTYSIDKSTFGTTTTQGNFTFAYGEWNNVSTAMLNQQALTVNGSQLDTADGKKVFYKIGNDAIMYLYGNAYTAFITFTAPAAGTYSFNFNYHKWGSSETVWADGGVSDRNDWSLSNMLYAEGTAVDKNGSYNLAKGGKIYFFLRSNANAGITINNLSVTYVGHIIGSYTETETTHTGICSTCGLEATEPEAHTGGEATCEDQAVCTVCGASYGDLKDHNYVDGSCTACGAADPDYVAPTPSFSASVSADPTDVSRGGSTTVKVAVNGTVYEKFAAGELEITYDAEKYDFISAKIGGADVTANAENGKVTVGFYGADLDLGTTVDLTFTAKDGVAIGTTSEFTLTAAAFSESETAASSDLIEAEITTATATTTVVARTFNVTVNADEDVKSAILAVEGNVTTVTEEQDYVITLPAGNDKYDWTATVGENTYNAADGKLTVPAEDISSDFTVSITRTAKTFTVTGTVTGDDLEQIDVFTGDPEATFGVDYTFTTPAPVEPDYVNGTSGVTYTVNAYYTGTQTAVVATPFTEDDTVTYTIAGASITADITVEIVKVVTEVNQYTVTVNGFDSDISGTATTLVNEGQPFSFTITPIAGFEYTVTSNDAVIVKEGNTYRIEAVNSNINITVTRTARPDGTYVYEYLDLNGATVYEVVVKGNAADGYGYTYDGNAMLYNAETDEYVYLVIVSGAFTVENASAKIGLAAGVINTAYNENGVDTDVNITGKTDANDAQLVYNIYASKTYDSFEALPMLKFLLADVNCNHSVDVEDAAAIINTVIA